MASQNVAVTTTLRDVQNGSAAAMRNEMRDSIKGKRGYRSEWPKTRKKRGVARRNKPSIQTWKFKTRRRGSRSEILVGNLQRHAVILERAKKIRGYKNRHYLAARRTWEGNSRRMADNARENAIRLAEASARRRAHAQEARQINFTARS